MAAKKAAGAAEKKSAPAENPVLTVSQLSARIEGVLRDHFSASVRVVGEVTGFRDRTHWYFDIKDEAAVANCVMFQSAARRAPLVPENGMQVVVRGRVEYYAKQGRVTLVVDSLEPVGSGALDLAFRRLVEEVRELGWLDPQRKRPVPRFPRRIAVVTSRSAAALQDVLVTMKARCPAVQVILADTRVQGDGAAAEIAAVIRQLSEHHEALGIDALLVTRGGGSKEDLWCFNERVVAEAIVGCAVPVVAAIGHETDVTLAELVADERCATPTQAAMRLTPETSELVRQLDSMRQRLDGYARRAVVMDRRRLETAAQRPMFRDPASIVRRSAETLDDAGERLAAATERRVEVAGSDLALIAARLERHRPASVNAARGVQLAALEHRLTAAAAASLAGTDVEGLGARLVRAANLAWSSRAARLDALERELKAVSPLRVLDRGFSVTMSADGRVVRTAGQVRPGERLTTRLADGQVESVVDGGGAAPAARAMPPRAEKPRRRAREEPDLFGGG